MAAALGPYQVGDRPRDAVSVTLLRDGAPVSLVGYADARIELTDPAGMVVDVSGVNVTHDNDTVSIQWPTDTSLFLLPGIYSMQVLLTTEHSTEHAAALTFEVTTGVVNGPGTWASLSDVFTLTGLTVDGPTLFQAQNIIEVFAGFTFEDSIDPNFLPLRPRDRRQLLNAVAYQAAFMSQNEAIYSRAAVAAISQDGLSITVGMDRATGSVDQGSLIIAPLARMALRMLSWKAATKSSRVHRRSDGGYSTLAAYNFAFLHDLDGDEGYRPL